ncbi:long-chain fatty acid--CoA ligase [Nocardioides humilatus]|uniref:Acyl-CoA synthetase n=1 Tax=Nocardioides humilatus TaxID=2607660 RepID=A0A5B1L930_9ACTN|nr:AMP-dependent synthetase/ligase [Nocardioides humilatus]KAA1416814.1 long-chain fatty acid--CoA ligase [Nocardioides humilatus]
MSSQPTTVVEAFASTVARSGDRTALRWREADGNSSSWTFHELADRVARATAGLRDLGVRPGDRVLLMLRNVAEFHVADLAVLFAGATPVSIYNSSSPEQVAYLAGHAGARLAIVEDAGFLARFDAALDDLPDLTRFVVVRDVPARDDVTAFASLLEAAPADLVEAASAVTPDDLATVIYTSGTTGNPKGVMVTHRNVCAEVAALAAEFATDLTGKRIVSYLPMAHIAERAISHYLLAFEAVEVTCCPDPAQLSTYLADVHPQVLFGVPRVWEKLRGGILAAVGRDAAKAASFAAAIEVAKPIGLARSWQATTPEQDAIWDEVQAGGLAAVRQLVGLDQVEFAITGAAPIPDVVIEWFNALGVPLAEVYGMSENTGAMTLALRKIKPGTVGKAVPGVEVALAEDGEVICRGDVVTPGYLDDPEKTAEAIDADGWLHTGDIGVLDDEGYLRIIDRKKELIITAGGKNISPANLEAALKTIPLVGQAFAVGDGQPYVGALVLLDPDVAPVWAAAQGLTELPLPDLAEQPSVVAEIERAVDEVMAGFNGAERVKKVNVLGIEWLPDSDELTPTSKLKRRVIKEKYAAEIAALYS